MTQRAFESGELRFTQPAVRERITDFAEETREDIEQGMGLKHVYNVNSVEDLVRILANFERTGTIPQRNEELVSDYLIFIRSSNIIDDNP